jgi:flagellar biosynthetic protein FliR
VTLTLASLDTVVLAAFVAFCRIGACFMLMPGFSSVRVPMNVRLFVAVAVSFALLVHLWDQIVPFIDTRPIMLLPMIVSELLIGALIGIVARFYLLALQFIGSAIAMFAGFGGMPGNAIEEPDAQTPVGAIISLTALLLLFILGFHHQIIEALVTSYRVAPVNVFFDPQSALIDLADTISESFLVVLRLGSPFVAYGILVNLATGFINKLSPQIPVYFISLPFVIAGALVLMYLAFPTMLALFAEGFADVTIAR